MRDDLQPVRELLPDSRVERVERLRGGGRSSVERVRLRSAGTDRTAVVKRFGGPGEGWVREVAALGILPPGIGPDVLAADAASGTVVLADLGDGPTLADALLGHDADADAAAEALCRWAEALAGLHRAARPLHDRFVAALAGHRGDQPVPASRVAGELADAALALPEQCAALGVVVPTGAVDELRGLATRLGSGVATPLSSLSPVDTCPDDAVLLDGRYRLVDFEGAQWRHVAWDVACLRVPWPTCWCSWRIPDDVAERAIDTYRRAAAAGLPEVADDAFLADLEAAAVGWASTTVTWFLDAALRSDDAAYVDREAPSRRATVLDRLTRAGRSSELPALAELARLLAAELRGRWGDVVLPLAPAFRAGS